VRLLDAFCGSGGAGVGYVHAGFDVFGVDIDPKPLRHYPFPHVCGDAIEYIREHGHEFAAIHASPPCQGYSIMHNLPWLRGRSYPLLIAPTLAALATTGTPYVVENVMGARHGAKGLAKRGLEAHGLQAGYLCGLMFGLPLYRHRLFATNWPWMAPGHPKHRLNLHPRSERVVYGGTVKGLPGGGAGLDVKPRLVDSRGTLTNWQGNGAQTAGVGVGHASGWRLAAAAMGIDWMDRDGLTQAIPPAFTEYIGRYLMKHLEATHRRDGSTIGC